MNPTTVQAIITSFFQVVVFGVAAYFIKSFITESSAKSIEQYKNELAMLMENHKLIINNELEKHKSELTINVNKQGKLYEKRVIIVDTMHEKLVAFKEKTAQLIRTRDEKENIEVEEMKAWRQSYDDFHKYLVLNKHFFKKALCQLFEDVIKIYSSFVHDFFYHHTLNFMNNIGGGGILSDEEKAYGLAVVERIKEKAVDVDALLEKLEDEFRILYGVED